MGMIKRGTRNIICNPVRLVLIVILLGVSLLFVAAMLALNESVQARLDEVNSQVGTSITIIPPGPYLSSQQFNAIVHAPGVINYAEESVADCYSTSTRFHIVSPFPTGPGNPNSKGSTQNNNVPGSGSSQGQKQAPAGTPVARSGGSKGGTSSGSQNQGRESQIPTGHTICYGFTPGAPAIMRLKGTIPGGDAPTITEGRMFNAFESDSNVAVIGLNLARANNLHPGATIALNGHTFTLVGVYTTGSIGDAFIILPVQTEMREFGSGINALTVFTSNATNVPVLLNTLRRELGDSFQFNTSGGQFDASLQSLNAIQRTSLLALLAALVASLLVIVFTVFLLVRERRREIGILRAIGAANWQVVGQLGIEILCLSLIASVLAVLLLFPFGPMVASAAVIAPPANQGVTVNNPAALLAATQPLTVTLTPLSVLLLLIAGLGMAALACLVPAWYVARLRPARALRSK